MAYTFLRLQQPVCTLLATTKRVHALPSAAGRIGKGDLLLRRREKIVELGIELEEGNLQGHGRYDSNEIVWRAVLPHAVQYP